MKNPAILALFLPFLLLACDDDDVSTKAYPKLDLSKIRLQTFGSCEDLDSARKARPQPSYGAESASQSGPLSMPASDSGNRPAGETNLQVAGVDEMDVTKADGDFIYDVSQSGSSSILVLRRSPSGSVAVIQKVEAGTSITGLFLTSDKLIAIGTTYPMYDAIPLLTRATSVVSPDYVSTPPETRVLFLSRNADGTLAKIGERILEGSPADARMVGDRLHLVLNLYLGYWYEGAGAAAPVERSLPKTAYADASERTVLARCQDVLYEPAASDPDRLPSTVINSLVGVVSIDTNHPEAAPQAAFIASNSASQVYASEENIFLVSGGWGSETPIHQVRLANAEQKTKYVGSLLVPGMVLNQFSMDEYAGHFRVATTSEGTLPTEDFSWKSNTVNQLAVFKLGDSDPQLVGSIAELAPGERIYSARFLGKQGFIVTFKKVDPLFAIDLSNPSAPVVRGELKIPGYSSYLHPMKEGYLLAVGKDAEAAQESDDFAWYQGMAMSIFDVRDLSDPKLVQKIGIGSRGTESEALHNHKAFRYIPEKNLVVLPISLYEGSNGQSDYGNLTFEGFQIYSATVENGFSLVGSSAFANRGQCYDYCWSSWGGAGRAFYHDGAISMVGGGELVVRSADNPQLDQARIAIE